MMTLLVEMLELATAAVVLAAAMPILKKPAMLRISQPREVTRREVQ